MWWIELLHSESFARLSWNMVQWFSQQKPALAQGLERKLLIFVSAAVSDPLSTGNSACMPAWMIQNLVKVENAVLVLKTIIDTATGLERIASAAVSRAVSWSTQAIGPSSTAQRRIEELFGCG